MTDPISPSNQINKPIPQRAGVRSAALVADSDTVTLGTHPENQLDAAAPPPECVYALDRLGRQQRDRNPGARPLSIRARRIEARAVRLPLCKRARQCFVEILVRLRNAAAEAVHEFGDPLLRGRLIALGELANPEHAGPAVRVLPVGSVVIMCFDLDARFRKFEWIVVTWLFFV